MKRAVTLLALVLIAVVFLSAPPDAVRGQEGDARRVVVTNFPETQRIAGAVAVDGPVRHSQTHRVREVLVPPVEPRETGRLIDGGVLTADGFTEVVLSLNAQAKGRLLRSGTVGAILVPEEESVTRVFEEEGLAQFPLEVGVPVTAGGARSFASDPARLTVGFPRYRVRFYNTSDKTVTVSLFAYLTN
jgi:hypothetical protein